jgi:hypothetical protein
MNNDLKVYYALSRLKASDYEAFNMLVDHIKSKMNKCANEALNATDTVHIYRSQGKHEALIKLLDELEDFQERIKHLEAN